MFTIVSIDTIKKFLEFYNIAYDSLSLDIQSLVVILCNMLFLLFWFIVAYILYRVLIRLF